MVERQTPGDKIGRKIVDVAGFIKGYMNSGRKEGVFIIEAFFPRKNGEGFFDSVFTLEKMVCYGYGLLRASCASTLHH